MQSLEFAYYHADLVDAGTAVIALSSSGETTRTVEALLMAQRSGSYTVALTNTDGSTLQREADTALKIEASRVGWPTQSSTAALALLLELAIRIAERRAHPQAASLRQAFDEIPDVMTQVLEELDPLIAGIADAEVAKQVQTVLFSGAGPNLASAIVGAAKVKECTTLHALDIQIEEYHHYNSQKAGEPLFLLAPSGPSVPRAVDTGTDALRWGGRLYVVTTDGEHAFDHLGAPVITLPAVPEPLSPLLYLLPAQLAGYHLGLASYAAAVANA
jgi:glucosamine 6-phosphate synthetase-like amidotransferase/phosphosugar isomerase protein